MTLTPQPRAVRNHNPGNIERNSIPWVGLMELSHMDAAQRGEQRFCVFETPLWGFRALAIILLGYQRRYRLKTVKDMIAKYAPPTENVTSAYSKAVALALGVEEQVPVDITNQTNLEAMCRAIAVHESGGWFFDTADLKAGVAKALAVPPQPLAA